MSDGAQMDILTRIEASLEFMNDGGPIRVDFVNLREVLEGSREALLKLDEYEHRAKLHMDRCQHDMERIVALEQQNEALVSRLETYQTALAQIAAFIEQQRQSVENRVVERRVTLQQQIEESRGKVISATPWVQVYEQDSEAIQPPQAATGEGEHSEPEGQA